MQLINLKEHPAPCSVWVVYLHVDCVAGRERVFRAHHVPAHVGKEALAKERMGAEGSNLDYHVHVHISADAVSRDGAIHGRSDRLPRCHLRHHSHTKGSQLDLFAALPS